MRSKGAATRLRIKLRRAARSVWRATRGGVPFLILFAAAGISFYLGIRLSQRRVSVPPPSSGKLEVVTLNVGEGEASFVRTPDGRFIVIGAGPPDQSAKLIAALRAAGARHVDLLCIPYHDPEASGGALDLMAAFPIGDAVEPAGPVVNKIQDQFRTACVQHHIPDHEVHVGQVIRVSDDVKIDVYGPDTYPIEPLKTPAANSLVLRLRYGKTAFLWAGGLDHAGEDTLLSHTPNLTANWLRVAHFGAVDATSDEFLRLVSPDYAVISVGVNDKGYPAKATLGRLEASGATILSTDSVATSLTFTSDGEQVSGPKIQ